MTAIRTFPDEANLYDRARTLRSELRNCIREKRPFPELEDFLSTFRARMSGLVDFIVEYRVFERDYRRNRKG